MGGFIGGASPNVSLIDCGSRASEVYVSYSGTARSGPHHAIGGFVGYLWGGVDRCYSTSNVTILAGGQSSGNSWQIGGFAGYHYNSSPPAIGYWIVNRSYASGHVTVTASATTNAFELLVGGFMGGLYGTRIIDCYAKGNVTVNRTAGTGAAHVGGLVGFTYAGSVLERCFSVGNVSSTNTAGNNNNVGGLVGDRGSDTGVRIENNVYLGNTVTRQGGNAAGGSGSSANVPRRIGNSNGTGFVNNFAFDGVTQNSNGTNVTYTGDRTGTGRDGANISRGNLGTPNWWLITAGYNGTEAWDYSRVHADFHPKLVGVGGQ